MAKQSTQSRSGVKLTNVPLVGAQAERFPNRLAYWNAPARQLNSRVKEASSDQAPGEEMVQVNDQYAGGGPPPESDSEHDQHQTGG
jgi:hypothetical protein